MHSETVKDLTEKGELLYNAMYGSTANNVQELLDKIHPDMGERVNFTLILLIDFHSVG